MRTLQKNMRFSRLDKKEKNNIKSNKWWQCFQYATTIALNFEEIKKGLQRLSNNKSFINNHSREGINYPQKTEDWKRFLKNNLAIARSILYLEEKEICPADIWKINSNCAKQIILFVIPNKGKESWYYLTVKNLSALLKGKTSKNNGDFYYSLIIFIF